MSTELLLNQSVKKYKLNLAFSRWHCVKSVQIRSFFWSVFSPNVGKCVPEKTPYLDTSRSVGSGNFRLEDLESYWTKQGATNLVHNVRMYPTLNKFVLFPSIMYFKFDSFSFTLVSSLVKNDFVFSLSQSFDLNV